MAQVTPYQHVNAHTGQGRLVADLAEEREHGLPHRCRHGHGGRAAVDDGVPANELSMALVVRG